MASVPIGPEVRAAYMKNLFAELERRERLSPLAQRDPGLVRDVEAASRAAWLPVSLNVRTVEAVCAHLGEAPGLELLAECVYAQFDTPLWRSFVGPAVRLLGKDPGSFGRWIPRGLQIVFRGCGVWSAEPPGECELRVMARELPPELARHRLWLRSLGIGMRPVFMVCGIDGTSDLEQHDEVARTATYHLTWKSASGPG